MNWRDLSMKSKTVYVILLTALVTACEPDRSALIGDAEIVGISYTVLSSCSNPFPVQFNASVNFDQEDTYLWDFGDGERSSKKNPKHTFASEGVYEVTLTVGNDQQSELLDLKITDLIPSISVRTPEVYPNSILRIENKASHYDSAFWEYRVGSGDKGIFYSTDFIYRVISLAPIEVTSVLLCKSGERVEVSEIIEVLPHTTNSITIDYLRYLPSFQPRCYVEFVVNGESVGTTHQKSNDVVPLDWTMPSELSAGTNQLQVSNNEVEIELLLFVDDKLAETYTLDTRFLREYRPTWIGFPFDPFFDVFNVRFSYN